MQPPSISTFQREPAVRRAVSFLIQHVGDWFGHRLTAKTRYQFVDQWRIPGTIQQVAAAFLAPHALSAWWPQHAAAKVVVRGDESGVGRVLAAQIKGFLPYTVSLVYTVTRAEIPHHFEVRIEGDFLGVGRGRLRQIGSEVQLDFELGVEIRRPLLQFLSLLVRPILERQHRWVMGQGQKNLAKTLRRQSELAVASTTKLAVI